ncbi:CMD domain protein [Marinibacterium sp. SX1]|uniref:CMD domain protein n=1 Tax=Marinibacterium sp. SX1 TaxID=3388424 RepID=UPI003D186A61
MIDVIDLLAGLAPDAHMRAARPVARENAQKSHYALMGAPAAGMMPLSERLAVAAFVAGLHRDGPATGHYTALLEGSEAAELAPAVAEATLSGLAEGPYGAYPPGPLSAEDQPGPVFAADAGALGARLAVAFDYVHMLVFHPRDAARADMERLAAAGWSATDIVTLSQLVSFLCFQIRAAAGLKTLAATL